MFSIAFGGVLAGLGVFIVRDVKKNGVEPDSTRKRIVIQTLGTRGARILYSIIGYVLILGGVGALWGGVEEILATM